MSSSLKPSDNHAPSSEKEGATAREEKVSPPKDAGKEATSLRLQRDRQLVRRLKAKDERAFQEMVQTYQNRIFGLAYRMLGNRQEAEDIAQEVFISVYRAIGNYRGEGRLYTWLYRIASNTCKNRIKYLKHRNFHRGDDPEESPAAHMQYQSGSAAPKLSSQFPGPEAVLEGNRLENAIQRELAELDPEHRLLIVLRDIQGLAYQDILRITGIPEGTLKSRLHRARVALKNRLASHLS